MSEDSGSKTTLLQNDRILYSSDILNMYSNKYLIALLLKVKLNKREKTFFFLLFQSAVFPQINDTFDLLDRVGLAGAGSYFSTENTLASTGPGGPET